MLCFGGRDPLRISVTDHHDANLVAWFEMTLLDQLRHEAIPDAARYRPQLFGEFRRMGFRELRLRRDLRGHLSYVQSLSASRFREKGKGGEV